jgi:hypothetical protein
VSRHHNCTIVDLSAFNSLGDHHSLDVKLGHFYLQLFPGVHQTFVNVHVHVDPILVVGTGGLPLQFVRGYRPAADRTRRRMEGANRMRR